LTSEPREVKLVCVSNTIDLGSGDDRLDGTPDQLCFYLLRMGVPT
jgi:hypothetical protein